jgi:hypothetical protein
MTESFSKITLRITLMGALAATLTLSGCGGARLKARQEQRDKLVTTTGLYCEWVNGEKHTDFDVELNLSMAKRCDSTRPFTIMPYKNISDQSGILYCCSVASFEPASGPVPAYGNAYGAPPPHRAAGPAARRVMPAPAPVPARPQPQAQAPAQTAVTAPTGAPTSAPSIAEPADSAPALSDDIVEDK